jgi:UDP-N-acetylmuramyl tripeptide synthase
MSLKNIGILLGVHLGYSIIKLLRLGAGSTWPGHIALHANPHFVKELVNSSGLKVILIAGTNGKTTTSTLVRFVLEKKGKRVFQNEEGANLMNGIASSLIRHTDLNGKINYDYAIFEVDENTLPLLLQEITPDAVIALNLFRDQLDRYGEVNTIAAKWHEAFKKLDPHVHLILNGDDPQIYFLGTDSPANILYFGLEDSLMEKKEIPHDVDSIYCPNCGEKLQYKKMSYSHLGDFSCPTCGFTRKNVSTFKKEILESSLKGIYNFYNISAALLLLEKIINLKEEEIKKNIQEFKPAFGRQEIIHYKNRNIFLLLSKNPTGFNQSIEAIKDISTEKPSTIMVLLNDRIPDGRDISWIWDVEFQKLVPLAKHIIVSGDRTYDMALRFKYCLENEEEIIEKNNQEFFDKVIANNNLKSAIEEAVSLTPENETLIILATYSAMLETREILVGRKLL